VQSVLQSQFFPYKFYLDKMARYTPLAKTVQPHVVTQNFWPVVLMPTKLAISPIFGRPSSIGVAFSHNSLLHNDQSHFHRQGW
jgi:hypothetical protein